MSTLRNSRRLMVGLGLAALVPLAGAAAVAAPRHAAHLEAPLAAPPPPPAASVTLLRTSADGDTLTYRLAWSPSVDERGPAERYTVMIMGSPPLAPGATATTTAPLVPAILTQDTTTTFAVVAPPYGQVIKSTASVSAVRRGLSSTTASVAFVIGRPDAAPPAPTNLRLDTLTAIKIGTVTPTDCTPEGGRLFTAGPYLESRSDTAFFVRPMDVMPTFTYCVDPRMVVLAEGDPAGQPIDPANPDSISLYLYPPGTVLPYRADLGFQPARVGAGQ